MAIAGEATAAPILVLLTLLIQNTGMATIVHWIRVRHTQGMYPLGVLGSCLLMVRFTSVIVVLHLLHIVMWAGFIAGGVFYRGGRRSTSRHPAIRRSAMEA